MNIKHFIAKTRVRFNRGYSWVAMFGIPFLVIDVIERRFPQIPFAPVFIASALMLLVIGYVDDKFGFLDVEQSFSTTRNKVMMEGLYSNGK